MNFETAPSESSSEKEVVKLNEGLVMTEDDIEETLTGDEPEVAKMTNMTLAYKQKAGYPTYHLNTTNRIAIVFDNGTQFYRLKEDSPLLEAYKKKYESRS